VKAEMPSLTSEEWADIKL